MAMKKNHAVVRTNQIEEEKPATQAVQIGEEEVPTLDELPPNEALTSRLVSDMFAYMVFHSYDTAANMAKVTKSYPLMVENLLIDTFRRGFRGGAFTRAQLAKGFTSGRLKRDVMMALRETREGCPDRGTGASTGSVDAENGAQGWSRTALLTKAMERKKQSGNAQTGKRTVRQMQKIAGVKKRVATKGSKVAVTKKE